MLLLYWFRGLGLISTGVCFLCLYACVSVSVDRLFSLVSHPRDEKVLREPVKELLLFTAVDSIPPLRQYFGNCFVLVIWEVLLNSCSRTPPLAND